MVSRVLLLLASVIVGRVLGKQGFGELGIIQSTVGMFGVLGGFGLGVTATRFVAEYREKDPGKAGRIMALSGLVAVATGGLSSVLLGIFAPWLAKHALAAPHLGGLLQLSAGLLFLTALNGAQMGALSGFEAFKTIAWISGLSGILALPLMVGGVYLGGLKGALWGLIVSSGLNWALNHWALRTESHRSGVPFSHTGCGREWKVIRDFSFPAVLSGLVVGPVTWVCFAMLVNQASGYAEMGVYNAALRVKQVPEMILGLLLTPLLPILSAQFGKRDIASYGGTLTLAFRLSLGVIGPVSLVLASVPNLVLLPFGKEFLGHPVLVQWLMLDSLLVGLSQPFGSILASMNRMWFGLAYNLAWGVTHLSLAYVLIPKYLGAGLGAAYALAHLLTAAPCVWYIYRYERQFISATPLYTLALLVLPLFVVAVAASRGSSPVLAGGVGLLAALACAASACLVGKKALPHRPPTSPPRSGF